MPGVITHREAYASGGPELITNSGFEANIVGWHTFGLVTVARDTNEQHSGLASLRVECGANDENGVGVNASAGMDGSGIHVGREYAFSAWVKADLGEALRLRLADGPGTTVEEPFVGTGDWQHVALTRVLVVDIVPYPVLRILPDTGNTSAPTFYVDDASFKQTELIQPVPVFRGSYLWLPPGPGRLVVKLRAGDSDAEDDRLTDNGDEPVETIRLYHRPAFSGLSDELE